MLLRQEFPQKVKGSPQCITSLVPLLKTNESVLKRLLRTELFKFFRNERNVENDASSFNKLKGICKRNFEKATFFYWFCSVDKLYSNLFKRDKIKIKIGNNFEVIEGCCIVYVIVRICRILDKRCASIHFTHNNYHMANYSRTINKHCI